MSEVAICFENDIIEGNMNTYAVVLLSIVLILSISIIFTTWKKRYYFPLSERSAIISVSMMLNCCINLAVFPSVILYMYYTGDEYSNEDIFFKIMKVV